MLERVYVFIKERPELKPVVDKLLELEKFEERRDVFYVTLEIVYQAGIASGIDRAITQLGVKDGLNIAAASGGASRFD